ncbi:MAG: glycosyltransferase family 2 protein [Bacteroidetes bacterium]|nr:glycosyltransferase family 2 protein [Bacteroidota bacterium]
MSKVAVVILNWNGRKFLEQFLPSVINNNPDFSEIIIADNASTDDSIDWLKNNYPSIRIISNASNFGFSKGYNESLKQVDAEYFVLLNSDVEVTSGWLEPVIKLMDSDSKIAACQPKIRAFHEPEKFEYAGAAGGFIDKWGYPFCRGRIFDTYETDEGQYNDSCEVFWATGACLFVRANAWKEVSGLDEDFFAHMEEIDLCWRMRNHGWKVMYCGDSSVFHVGGGTLAKQNPKKTFLNFRNNLLLLVKNHSTRFFILKIFLRMCLDGIAGMKFLLSGEINHCFAVIHAHFSFYGMLGKTLSKRNAMKKEIEKYATTCIYEKTLIMEYFFRGKKKFSDLDKAKFSK